MYKKAELTKLFIKDFWRRQTDKLSQFYNTLAYFVLVGYHDHLFCYLKKSIYIFL